MRQAIAWFSGGLVWSTLLATAESQGLAVAALASTYGPRHRADVATARPTAEAPGVNAPEIVDFDYGALARSALRADLGAYNSAIVSYCCADGEGRAYRQGDPRIFRHQGFKQSNLRDQIRCTNREMVTS